MKEFKEIKIKLDEDIENNQNIFFDLLENQSIAHSNVITLKKEFEKIKKIVYNDSQIEPTINQEKTSDKIADLMALKVSQILQHRDSIMKYKGISQVLKNESKLFTSNMNQNTILKSTSNKEIHEEINESQFLIEKIQYCLLDGRIEEALEEYKILIEKKDKFEVENFISIQILKQSIINELIIKIEQSAVTDEISYLPVEKNINHLLYLKQEKIAIESFLNYSNKIISYMEFSSLREKIKKIILKFSEIITNMNNLFSTNIPTMDYKFYLESWMKNHIYILVKEITSISINNKSNILQLEELRIELGEFDLKGFCFDFIIDSELIKLKINEKSN